MRLQACGQIEKRCILIFTYSLLSLFCYFLDVFHLCFYFIYVLLCCGSSVFDMSICCFLFAIFYFDVSIFQCAQAASCCRFLIFSMFFKMIINTSLLIMKTREITFPRLKIDLRNLICNQVASEIAPSRCSLPANCTSTLHLRGTICRHTAHRNCTFEVQFAGKLHLEGAVCKQTAPRNCTFEVQFAGKLHLETAPSMCSLL